MPVGIGCQTILDQKMDIIRHKNRNRQVGELGNLGQRGVVVKL